MKKRSPKPSTRKGKPKWHFILLIIIAVIIISALVVYSARPTNQPNYKKTSKAAIIDSLWVKNPNPQFIENATKILRDAGFDVDLYQGNNVTINLFMNVGGYDLIVLRVHSAIDVQSGLLYLFSTERYNMTGYLYEQLSGAVREAYTFDLSQGSYFSLRADLLGHSNKEGINGSNVIIMGCNGTNSRYTVNNLFQRGVKRIIAWDGYVDLAYSDKVTLALLEYAYRDKIDFPNAVEKIMGIYGNDPTWNSSLKCLTRGI